MDATRVVTAIGDVEPGQTVVIIPTTLRELREAGIDLTMCFGVDDAERAQLLDDPAILRITARAGDCEGCDGKHGPGLLWDVEVSEAHLADLLAGDRDAHWRSALIEMRHEACGSVSCNGEVRLREAEQWMMARAARAEGLALKQLTTEETALIAAYDAPCGDACPHDFDDDSDES